MSDGKKYEQGASYQEDPTDDAQDYTTNENESLLEKIMRFKFFIIGGIVLIFVLIIGVVVISQMNASAEKEKLIAQEKQKQEQVVFKYLPEEREQLRLLGFNGDEISNFELASKPVSEIENETKAKQEEKLISMYSELKKDAYKNGSKEYKRLLDLTYLGGDVFKIDENGSEKRESIFVKENLDYKKLPIRGVQLQIMLTRPNGLKLFLTTTPARYLELADEGNMVVSYNIEVYGDSKFVTDIREVLE